jgi:hypothetical protein
MKNITAPLADKHKYKDGINYSLPTRVVRYKPVNAVADHTLYRQRNLGNRAMQAMAESKVIQAKLTVGQPNDKYEQEADRTADQVMRMPEETSVQRKPLCPECTEEEETIQMVQMKQSRAGSGHLPVVTTGVASRIRAMSGSGQSLAPASRDFFQSRFGQDFSHVRVHTGNDAAGVSKDLNARAFTLGRNIYFGAGAYNPETPSGKRLLAHELTHVVQQGQDSSQEASLIRRTQTDAGYEAAAGLDDAITDGTMVEDSIMGWTYAIMGCASVDDCIVRFRFPKAYTGVYHYLAHDRDVRGVYVKISASYNEAECGPCNQLLLIQTLRYTAEGSSGDLETARPTTSTRRERAGWDDPHASSRGWMIDQTESATDPLLTPSHTANTGSSTTPAELWDAPGHWLDVHNHGKEFQTCAVREQDDGSRDVLACVNWGYYTDSEGNVNFRPATPSVSCGPTQELHDASSRWDAISGNQPTGIDFP